MDLICSAAACGLRLDSRGRANLREARRSQACKHCHHLGAVRGWRRVHTGNGARIVVSDTVGFIRRLPHTLVAAFRATLEETVHADLLLHVVDASSPTRDGQIEEVNKVLAEIGADAIPQLLVWNKIDLNGVGPGIDRDECGTIARVRMSARTGAGLDDLRQALAEAAAAKTEFRRARALADTTDVHVT